MGNFPGETFSGERERHSKTFQQNQTLPGNLVSSGCPWGDAKSSPGNTSVPREEEAMRSQVGRGRKPPLSLRDMTCFLSWSWPGVTESPWGQDSIDDTKNIELLTPWLESRPTLVEKQHPSPTASQMEVGLSRGKA